MRRVLLQMGVSLDGIVAGGPEGKATRAPPSTRT